MKWNTKKDFFSLALEKVFRFTFYKLLGYALFKVDVFFVKKFNKHHPVILFWTNLQPVTMCRVQQLP